MLVILIGKSGSGKDSIKDFLCNEMEACPLVSTTTREMRPSEKDGVDYHFTTNEDFENKIKSKIIFEYREYNGAKGKIYYGAEYKPLNKEKTYVKVLDPDGARNYIDVYGRNNCFVAEIYLDDSIRFERAFKRRFGETSHSDAETEKFINEWDTRLNDDNSRFSNEKLADIVNFSVDNQQNLETTVEELCCAMMAYKERMSELAETAHLHTDMVYPKLIIEKNPNGYSAHTESELERLIVTEQHYAIEKMESLDR